MSRDARTSVTLSNRRDRRSARDVTYTYTTRIITTTVYTIITTVYAFEPISSAVSRRRIANAGFLAADDARATLQLTRYFPATRLASFSSAVAAYVAVAARGGSLQKRFPESM